jgi:hypothetical protein
VPEPFLPLTGEEIHLTPEGRAEGARIIRALRRNIRVGGEGDWQIALPWRPGAPRTG